MKALALVLVVIAAGVAVVVEPWRTHAATGGEMTVTRATLRPGQIALVVSNRSDEEALVAHVIVADAYVDFRASARALAPGGVETLTLSYPWIRGESYDIELLTSTGAAVEYELEEAEPS